MVAGGRGATLGSTIAAGAALEVQAQARTERYCDQQNGTRRSARNLKKIVSICVLLRGTQIEYFIIT